MFALNFLGNLMFKLEQTLKKPFNNVCLKKRLSFKAIIGVDIKKI